MTSKEVNELIGHKSRMWYWRRLNDETSGFPQPKRIGHRLHWWRSDILSWLRSDKTLWSPPPKPSLLALNEKKKRGRAA